MTEAQKEAKRAAQRIASLDAERLERVRKRKREFMRRKLASLSAEDRAAYLAKRREREIPIQRKRRAASEELREKNRLQTLDYYWRNRESCVARQKEYRQRQRDRVFAHYGNFCACCGEDEPAFLTIDHINGDGAEHRRAIGGRSGFSLYALLAKEGFPAGFQVLCYNCNSAKRTGKECPHRAIVRFRLFNGGLR